MPITFTRKYNKIQRNMQQTSEKKCLKNENLWLSMCCIIIIACIFGVLFVLFCYYFYFICLQWLWSIAVSLNECTFFFLLFFGKTLLLPYVWMNIWHWHSLWILFIYKFSWNFRYFAIFYILFRLNPNPKQPIC